MTSTRRQLVVRQRRGIRTGCIVCLRKGVRCDRTNPDCVRRATSRWKSDSCEPAVDQSSPHSAESTDVALRVPDLSIDQLNFASPTAREAERHSFQFFISFTAPQIAGAFDNPFWQEMVIRAAYHETAVLHGLIALGSLHEGIITSSSQPGLNRNPKYTFALQHINSAIHALTAVSRPREEQPDMRMILTLCILLTTFEAMQGRTSDAMQHTMQGVKLFQARNAIDQSPQPSPSKPYPVPLIALTGQLNQFAFSASVYADEPTPFIFDTRMPVPARFHTLAEAEMSLRNTRDSISMLATMLFKHPSMDFVASCARELHHYRAWLEQWRQSFGAFLEWQRPFITPNQRRLVLILEATYYSCLCNAAFRFSDRLIENPYARFLTLEPYMTKMVELSEKVIQMEPGTTLPLTKSPTNSYLSFGTWILEPLYLAAAYSSNLETRRRGGLMLASFARPEALTFSGPFQNVDSLIEIKNIEIQRANQRQIANTTSDSDMESISRQSRSENMSNAATSPSTSDDNQSGLKYSVLSSESRPLRDGEEPFGELQPH